MKVIYRSDRGREFDSPEGALRDDELAKSIIPIIQMLEVYEMTESEISIVTAALEILVDNGWAVTKDLCYGNMARAQAPTKEKLC